MKKFILGLAATAAVAVPLAAMAGAASAAPAPAAKATGSVTWDFNGEFNGTVRFDANNNTGGTLDYTNSFGSWLHGTVTPGTVVKAGNTVTFRGTFSEGSPNYDRLGDANYFVGVVTDGGTSGRNGDKIAVFVNEKAYDVAADVTGGNLTVH